MLFCISFCFVEVCHQLFHLGQQTVYFSVVGIVVQRVVHFLINVVEQLAQRLDPFLSVSVLKQITAALIFLRCHLLEINLYVWFLSDVAVGDRR